MSIFITAASLMVAVAASLIAWLMVREERLRSDARVAALLSASDPTNEQDEDDATRPAWPPADDARAADGPAQHATASRNLFDGEGVAAAGPFRVGVVAASALVLVGALSAAWLVSRSGGSASASAVPARAAALELVSLSHERRGAELTITGLVRNPADGSNVESAQAVVFLFDEQSRFVTSARSPLEIRRLAPGDESPFRITVAVPIDLGRYRVSFRRAEGGLVPHVDWRAAPTAAPQGHDAAPIPAPARRAEL